MLLIAPEGRQVLTTSPAIHSIETERLRLRIFAPTDLDAFARITGDAEAMRYIGTGQPVSREETRDNIQKLIGGFKRRGYGRWAVVHKRDQQLIGYCGLTVLDQSVGVELAYLFGRPYWGAGFAYESARAVLRYGFEELQLEHIAALTKIDNRRSRRLLSKLGMTYTGPRLYFGALCASYSLSQDEYLAEDSSAPYRVIAG